MRACVTNLFSDSMNATEANGKSKMSTINVVRNKLLYTMFAMINRRTSFIGNYLQEA